MLAQPARRAGALPPAGVPRVQALGDRPQPGEPLERVDQVGVVLGVQVLAPQLQPQVAGEPPGAVAVAGRVARLALVALLVEHRAGQLAVVRPAAQVEVVAADGGPDVVDDADLGVDVHRRARVVLQVEHAHPVAPGVADGVERVLPSDEVRRARDRAALVRVARDDGDQVQLGGASQRLGEQLGDLGGPQVLVLEVDEPGRPAQRLAVRRRDAALAPLGERVAGPPGGIGPQHLDRAAAAGGRVGRLRRQLAGVGVDPLHQAPLDRHPQPVVQRRRVVPALAEHRLEVADDRPVQLELDVVPGRRGAVLRGHPSDCGSPACASSSRRLWHRSIPPANATSSSCPRATTSFWWWLPKGRTRWSSSTSPPASLTADPRLRFSSALNASPSTCERHSSPLTRTSRCGCRAEDRADLAAGLAGQPLVGVAAPVGEAQQVAGGQPGDHLGEPAEVRRAVHERPHVVAGGPGRPVGVPAVQRGPRVVPLLRRQEPRVKIHERP